jgi:site-specific recombinase
MAHRFAPQPMKKPLTLENHQSAMERVLDGFVDGVESDIALLNDLVSCMRPRRARDSESARHALRTLCLLIEHRRDYRVALRSALFRLLTERTQLTLYTDVGIFPNNGFFTEVTRRLVRSTLLPDLFDLSQLRDVIARIFKRASDHLWVRDVGVDAWTDLLRALRFDEAPEASRACEERGDVQPLRQLLEALRVLSYRIAAIGLEPEMQRHEPTLHSDRSPFIAQNQELMACLARLDATLGVTASTGIEQDEGDMAIALAAGVGTQHLVVLLDQCREVGDRIRRRAARAGTSVSLTLHLLRLNQHLARAEQLIDVVTAVREARGADIVMPLVAELASELIQAECCRNNLRDYFRQNVELISLRVTENAGHTGEHYIAQNRKDYFSLLRSAILGGFIIGFMSAFKFVIAGFGWTPLNESIGFGLNYGIGFVLIHVLHGTVATKQPAMTAHALAAAIKENSRKGGRDLDNLVTLIVRTMRSQTAAIIGNVALAVPVAILIGLAFRQVTGHAFISPARATELLGEVAFKPSTLIYAALAGVCLFLAGQINGYCDNVCAYERIPERIAHVRWARRIFGERNLQRIANYVRGNLGALIGNFVFGFMLAGVWGAGMLFGLPLDIRHVAFASTYSGFASVSLDFAAPHTLLLAAMLGTWAIGAINLFVSFSLAMWVALRARRVTFVEMRRLFGDVLRRLRQHPREFFFPPNAHYAAADDAPRDAG